MKYYNHIIRFSIVLIIIIIGFFVVRSVMVPESFGIYGTYTYGYHRGKSDIEQKSIYALFQGSDKCKKCHTEEFDLCQNGDHTTLTCETCHGNWKAHNNNTKEQVIKDKSVEACMLCHQHLQARPAEFPQITGFTKHLADQDLEFEKGMLCLDCHDPHEPM